MVHANDNYFKVLQPSSDFLMNAGSLTLIDWPDENAKSIERLQLVNILPAGLPADLFYCESCSSTFDLGWELTRRGLLKEWGAVLAFSQKAGRGQLRRGWFSPEGNLYVSFRLPDAFLAWEGASVMAAQLLIEAFSLAGLELKLKWPNDLALEDPACGKTGKVGGILLEEHGETLLCGLGANCRILPPAYVLREGLAMEPALLPAGFRPKDPLGLWLVLVQRMKMVYQGTLDTVLPEGEPLPVKLIRGAEARLLWKNSKILVHDSTNSRTPLTGFLRGLSQSGGLLLYTGRSFGGGLGTAPDEEIAEIYSGSINLIS